jgi:hypothetical protein
MEIFEPRATAEAVGEDKRELRGRPRSLARFRASERRITFFCPGRIRISGALFVLKQLGNQKMSTSL